MTEVAGRDDCTEAEASMRYDVLVIGGGIAGMEAALTAGDMGHRVLLVEKEASIGGKMILLSKVFPTLDCASCISTPKMASAANHPNVTVLPYSEVDEILPRGGGSFLVRLHRKATYVDSAACTGCGQCEAACTVAVSDRFNANLVARRAAHIPFAQAVPKKALIERAGTSPCSSRCPAGVKAHGYVSLVRSGKHEAAFDLHLEDAPLPGSLSRACYAPCEGECTRGGLEGSVGIRAIKRFMVDRYYAAHPEPTYGPPEDRRTERVAVVGSGPAGLSAAYHLARRGYEVTIFEAAPEPGGMLRYGIPAYRLPKDVVARDIRNVTALGVTIETGARVTSVEALGRRGFSAVFLAVGTLEGRPLGVAGEDLEGVVDCMTFLRRANGTEAPDLAGKTVVVVGGGNAAIDPARMALRLGASRVCIQYRRSRAEMPAHEWEVEAALAEGVELRELTTPTRFLGVDGALAAIECLEMELGEPDSSGRRRPVPVAGSERLVPADLAILAIGLAPGTEAFAAEVDVDPRRGTFVASPATLQTSVPWVFAGGDAVSGPSMIVEAIGQGKRAAHFMDLFLRGEPLDAKGLGERLPAVDSRAVLSRGGRITRRPASRPSELPAADRSRSMVEVEGALDEEAARREASRCLDCGVCSECHECVAACPANAIDFGQRSEERLVEARSVVLATGFELFDPHMKEAYGYGRFPNVVTAMQMDRLLAPTRPYDHVLRPSDGKAPDNIAFVLCTGSRDPSVGNPACSRVCCMYSIKQAQLIMGALPMADVTIYYIDIRSFGKGYDEFYRQAREMGISFVRGRVARVEPGEGQNLTVVYEDVGGEGGVRRMEHDLVVLSVGLVPNLDAAGLFSGASPLGLDELAFIEEVDPDLEPGRTTIDGVFVAGAASTPRDIPDSIVHAGAAAAQVAAYLERTGSGR